MEKIILRNLDCVHCAKMLEEAIQETPGVENASIDFVRKRLHVDAKDFDLVKETISRIQPGVKIENIEEDDDKDEFENRWKEITPLIIASLFYFLGLVFLNYLSSTTYRLGEYLVFGIAYLISGWRVVYSAFKNVARGQVFDENFLMTVATIGAVAIGEIPEAAGVMIFYMIGEYIQERSVGRSRQSLESLLKTRPEQATIIRDGKTEIVHPDKVAIGDKFIVKPGERIPIDGKILHGDSILDLSPLTGESKPEYVKTGDSIYAGAINRYGLLKVEAERQFSDSSISRIVELTENAITRKTQTEKFITRFAKIYSPLVVFGALALAVFPPLFLGGNLQEWIYRALVVLVISCPCALVISIPLGYFGGIGGASRRGILVKGSNFLDVLASLKTVVFDKTGTLTKGEFKVTDVITHNGYCREEVVDIASKAAAGSNHPIAQSITKAKTGGVDLLNTITKEIVGKGIKANVDGKIVVLGNDALLHKENINHDEGVCEVIGTSVHVAIDGNYAGYIKISDELKPDSMLAIQKLRETGVTKIWMLTGDKWETANKVAEELEIDGFMAGLLPEEKTSALETILQKDGKIGKVGFVGDGINDAPALARADVGIAMGALGSAAAIEAADVVIMTDSPVRIVDAVQIGRKTRTVVWQNIILALLIKIVFIILGITGNATMWQAVFGDMGVALIAILNASRIYIFNSNAAESKV